MPVPPNVPPDVTRKALRGRVNCRKAGYRVAAAQTPPTATASPAIPPTAPPLRVSLFSSAAMSKDHELGGVLVMSFLFFLGEDLHR